MCQSDLTELFALTEFAAELTEFYLPKKNSQNSVPPVSYLYTTTARGKIATDSHITFLGPWEEEFYALGLRLKILHQLLNKTMPALSKTKSPNIL